MMIKLPLDTTFDRIFSFYVNDSPLTEKEEQIRIRWEAGYSLLNNYHSSEQAIPVLMKRFEISKAQAYRDLNNSIKLFGDISKTHKDGLRNILYEYAMKVFQLAASCKPPDIGEMNKAISNMIKMKGLDKEDPDMPDFASLQPHTYIIANDPKTLGFPEIPNLDQVIENFKKKQAKKEMDITDAELAD